MGSVLIPLRVQFIGYAGSIRQQIGSDIFRFYVSPRIRRVIIEADGGRRIGAELVSNRLPLPYPTPHFAFDPLLTELFDASAALS